MPKGIIALIGGGEDSQLIFKKIFSLGNDYEKRLAIIPAASSHAATTLEDYEDFFVDEIGIPKNNIWLAPIALNDDNATSLIDESEWKDNAYHSEMAEKIKSYNVVFFVGGDQRKYIDALKNNNIDSPLLKEIETIYNNGGIIIGTSAGTNILCEHSIAGGTSEEALQKSVSYDVKDDDGHQLLLLKGFGFAKDIVFDTHIDVRGRFGRIAESAVLTKCRWGLGISEKTAVIYHADQTIEVVGFGDVLLIDLKNALVLNKPDEPLHLRNATVYMFTHGDKFNMEKNEFTPYEKKENIKNTPYFDFNDYHISLNVFKDYETSHILVNYMLDNEAKDVIAMMDYDMVLTDGDTASFLRYVEQDETDVWYCKLSLEEGQHEWESYSGTNILFDIIPTIYQKKHLRPDKFNAVLFGTNNDLQVVVYDNTATLPILDAKIFIYNTEGKLLYKKGTDRYGRALLCNTFSEKERYTIKVVYENERKEYEFEFEKNMKGVCLI
jgi:cyanophycinase